MSADKSGDKREELFDAYLDSLLRGDEFEPEAFMAAHESEETGDTRLPEWLHEVWGLVQGESPQSRGAPLEQADSVPLDAVGAFRLLRPIGEGGMGRVFLARQEPLGRLCAVKLLRAETASSPTASARLEREARLVASLTHDNILRVLEAGQSSGIPWVAFELVPGQNLDEVCQDSQPSVSQIVMWGVQLASALEHAHQKGIVHRDLKPSNVRINPEGRALLLDFGLAKHIDRETLQLTHAFTGTPAYVAPEQVRGGDVDGRCDVYGLGATLYEAICGVPPFEGATIERVLHAVVNEDPMPPTERGMRLPKDLETIILHALEKDPGDRYQSASDMRADLLAVLELRPIQARPPGRVSRGIKWARRNRASAGALLAVLVAGLAWVGIEWGQNHAAKLSDQKEANTLLSKALDTVNAYGQGRTVYEKSLYDLRRAEMEMARRHFGAPEIQELTIARANVTAYEALKVSIEEVPVLLGRADRLHPGAPRIANAWASYWYQLWMDVRDDNSRELADHYAARIHDVEPDGEWAEKVSGQVALQIVSTPPGASVRLYRVMSHVEPAGVRFVPAPFGGMPLNMNPGAWALEVLQESQGLEVGDSIVSVAGQPVRNTLLARMALEGEDVWCKLVTMGGTKVTDLWSAQQILGRDELDRTTAKAHWVQGQAESESHAFPLPSLDSLRTPEQAVAEGSIEVGVWRDGEIFVVSLHAGINSRTTGAPLLTAAEARVGTTPLEFPASDPGYYVAVLNREGHEPQRLSFHIDHACEHYSKGLVLTTELNPTNTTPSGFAYIDSGSFFNGGQSFWMARTEVTCGEYLEYLNDPQTLMRVESGALLLPLVVTGSSESHKRWGRSANGAVSLPKEMGADWPILGVTAAQAQGYVRWFGEQAWVREKGLRAALPKMVEWRWAAYGGDGRDYVHGDKFSASWVKGRFTREFPIPEPVGSFPLDESPWGILDMAGSASEWVHQVDANRKGGVWALCGGAWNLSGALDFAIAKTRYPAKDALDPGAGIRVVLHRE